VSESEDDLEEELKDEVKPIEAQNEKEDSEEPDEESEEENENGLIDDDEKYYRPMVFTEYQDPIMKKLMGSSIFNMN
jgi:hypothetical protein